MITLVVIVVVVVGGWWFLTQSQQTAAPQTPETTETSTEVQSTPSTEATDGATMEGVKELEVSGTEFAFTPKTLSVKQGEKVKIIFTNDGKFPHNLTIDELNVATKTIGVGQTDTVEFMAEKSGSFVMYCSVSNHRQQGMEGKVSVQ